jgi:hypothetical protein
MMTSLELFASRRVAPFRPLPPLDLAGEMDAKRGQYGRRPGAYGEMEAGAGPPPGEDVPMPWATMMTSG